MINLIELAMRIKSARKEKGMTLDVLSSRSGVAKGIISKVENFRVTPSLPSIVNIAAALKIPLTELFKGLDKAAETCVVRKSEIKHIERNEEDSNIEYYDLANPRPNRRMDPLELIIPPGGGRTTAMTHEGEEFLRVLEGQVTIHLNDEEHLLGSGDSIYFDAEIPHNVTNDGKIEARVLCVFLAR
ncbi:MAG: cupin domain-containing protein [Akkermansiaceae bacterium]|nr:cupin domain-containing protein [Akkermansiaceae bacterium]